jgi:SAM-dependent methyltransferase
MDSICKLTPLLKCPLCGLDLRYGAANLFCRNDHSFSYHDNVVDFSTVQEINSIQQRSKQSFQIEWTQYYQNLGWASQEFPDEKHMFLSYTRAMPNFFMEKIVIDAGCGNGRYINIVNKITAPQPALIIGIDLSDAIYIAAKNSSSFKNAVFMKMDINLLPRILKVSVDYIYSIGVLHHTPDAQKTFSNLAKCVKKVK